MSRRDSAPFEQAPLSRRERRAAERRAAERAAARAEAMPPPNPSTRVEPTGLSGAGGRRQVPTVPARQPSHPQTSAPASQPDPQPPVAGAWPPVPGVPQPPTSVFSPPVVPGPGQNEVWLEHALAGPGAPNLSSPPAAAPAAAGPSVFAALRAPWRGQWAQGGLVAGAAGAVAGFGAALGWGAPVLGHGSDWRAAAGGAAALAVAVGAMSRGWAHGGVRLRRVSAVVATVLAFAFALGVTTNPVVVDGHVFLSTSKEAKQYRMMRQVHDDLLRLRKLDAYLTYTPADAGAHYTEYAPALAELTDMSAEYASYSAGDLPDAKFADTVAAMKSAAYWAAKAMESKIQLLEEEDARYADNVATARANFAEQYVAAGRALQFLSADLNIPIDTREHE